jgi:hypothetical protein
MGMLAGLFLAKTMGPKLLAGRAELSAVPAAIRSPIREHTYLPLEILTSEVLAIVNRELKWLRLKQLYEDFGRYGPYLGHTLHVRQPADLYPILSDDMPWPPRITEHLMPVRIDHVVGVDIELEHDMDWRQPYGKFSTRYVEPAAMALAERVIGCVRANGGAEYLVSVDQKIPSTFERCILSKDPGVGLSLRGSQLWKPIIHEGQIVDRVETLRLDMLFGLG